MYTCVFVYKTGDEVTRNFLSDILKDFAEAGNNVTLLLNLSERIRPPTDPKKILAVRRELSMLYGALFVLLFEGFYICRIDAICLLLIANGHDLFDPLRLKYVKSPVAIGKVNIDTKFKFLTEHKLSSVLRKQDQFLRNKIAHNDFKVEDNGEFLVNGNRLDIRKRLDDLFDTIEKLGDYLCSTIQSLKKMK